MKKKRMCDKWKEIKSLCKTFLIMKLTFVLCVFFTFHLSASTLAQDNRISLKLDNATLEEFIEELKEQTNISFFYNASLFSEVSKVSINVQNVALKDVLKNVLEKRGFDFDFEDDVIVIKMRKIPSQPQQTKRTVKGVVKDETGVTLPGVAVLIKGSTTGVVTDNQGNYSISVSSDSVTLQFSFLGLQTKEEVVGKRSEINVVLLSDTKKIDEVVVTGYQTISRERATGSFDLISADQLSRPTSDLASRLVGVTAGVQSNLDADGNLIFEIRGQTSLNKDNARPLIVVDGFPVEGEFSSINPNDVESVTILKDAAAASIWGARSANGVIVVTTKRGKMSAKKGAKIEVSAFVKVAPKLDLDYYNPLASSAETVEYEQKGFETEFFGVGGLVNGNYWEATVSYSQAVVALNEHRLGHLSDTQLNTALNKLQNQNNKDQIRKYLLQNPLTHQYNVNISGANERSSNLLSLMYESDRDGFKENKKDKLMVNYRTDVKLSKWLDFNFSGMVQYNKIKNSGINASSLPRYASFANYTSPSFGAAIGSIKELSPYDMLVNEDGTRTQLSGNFYVPILESQVPSENFPYVDWSYNPITEIENRDLGRKELNTRIQGGFLVRLWEGFTFDTKLQYEMYNTYYKDVFNENTYYVRRLINTTSSWDKISDEVTPNLAKGGIRDEAKVDVRAFNFRNQLNFVRTFEERHAVNVIAGMEISERVREQTTYARTYGYNNKTLSVGIFPNGPMGSGTKDWQGSSNDYNYAFSYTNGFNYISDRYFSLFANAAYTFDDKYTLSGSVRTDASNLITDDPKYRYSPFWSIGLGWQIGKEKFMQKYDWIDRLNVRLTYGYNGNVDRSTSFRPLINVSPTQNTYIQDVTATIQSFGNPFLRWEKTGTWDFGVDYTLLEGKLFGKIDVYSKMGKDLIASMTIPSVNGTSTQALNAAEMTNRGIELEVGTSLKILENDITWSGSVNFSYNKNRIRKLHKSMYTATELYEGSTRSYLEGYDANTLWVFKYAGVINKGNENNPDWQPVVEGANGDMYDFTTSTPGDGRNYMKHAGTKVAPYSFGFSNSFKIYDFNISFLITGKFGHKFLRQSFNYPSMWDGKALPNKYYQEIVSSDPSDRVPIPFGKSEPRFLYWNRFYPVLDYLVENAGHVRLREINISYQMPSHWLSRIGINSLALYAQGNDLYSWFNNKYDEDPEHPLGSVKPQATYTFGLRFDF